MPGICSISRWRASKRRSAQLPGSWLRSAAPQILPLAPQHADEVAHTMASGCMTFSRISGIACNLQSSRTPATLQQEGPQLVDHGRSASNQPIAHTMHRLKVELIVGLDRNEAHVLPMAELPHPGSRSCWTLQMASRTLGWDQLHVVCLDLVARALYTGIPIREVCMGVGRPGCFCVNFLRNTTLPARSALRHLEGSLAQVNANRMNLHVDDPP